MDSQAFWAPSFGGIGLYFQLHVMDSGLDWDIYVDEDELSTPCNGFAAVARLARKARVRQLSTPCNGFTCWAT